MSMQQFTHNNIYWLYGEHVKTERRWILLKKQLNALGVVTELRLWETAVSVNTLRGQCLIISVVSVF